MISNPNQPSCGNLSRVSGLKTNKKEDTCLALDKLGATANFAFIDE